MANLLTRGQRVQVHSYAHDFRYKEMPSAGFSVTCTEDGTILGDEYHNAEERTQQYNERKDDPTLEYRGITHYQHSYWEPATMRCSCGRVLSLSDPLDNECECGKLYNSSGQGLRPREEWEEPWDND